MKMDYFTTSEIDLIFLTVMMRLKMNPLLKLGSRCVRLYVRAKRVTQKALNLANSFGHKLNSTDNISEITNSKQTGP
jgi:hypothetical protein